MKRVWKILLGILLVLFAVAGIVGYKAYEWIQGPNVRASVTLYIPTGTSHTGLTEIIEEKDFLSDRNSFKRVAGWMKFDDQPVKPGRYEILRDWSNRQLVNALRSGRQAPVKVTFNNVRTITELSGRITENLEMDSLQFLTHVLATENLAKWGYSRETILSLFIPNTYEMFWTTSTDALISRMLKENESFWNQDNRGSKAEALSMTPEEVYTLASIVEKETQAGHERPRVAGLYLNRIQKKIPLQADPTVVFAVGDFEIRRVLNKHLEMDSPYNTYRFAGLPPGPIYMPSISSIDAVLNAEDHNYLYMCARPDNSGLHAFAETIREHNNNANRYRRWLDQRGIF